MHKTLIGLALVSAVALSGCGSATASSSQTTSAPSDSPTTVAQPRFTQVVLDCEGVPNEALADAGQTLTLDVKGEEDAEGISIQDAACALVDLGMPSRVSQEMDRTTAMMGVQHDAWDGIEISWTYHPDNGLNAILSDSTPTKPLASTSGATS